MEITSEIFDKVERYLSGAMSFNETKIFENEIESSAELKLFVNEQRIERQNDLFPQFKEFLNREIPDVKVKPSPIIIIWYKRPIFRYAALILLFFGIGYIAYNNFQKASPEEREQLASHYNESKQYADDNKAIKEDTSFTVGQDFRIKFFENDFPFQSNLNSFIPKNKYEEQCKQYWQAWFFIKEKKYESAVDIFEKLWKELPEGEFHQKAAIGLMKGLLLTKNDDRLKDVVEKIIAEKEEYPEALKFAKEVKVLLQL